MTYNKNRYDSRPIDLTPFYKRFPDNQSCIDHLTALCFGADLSRLTCGKCGTPGKTNFYIYANTSPSRNPRNIIKLYKCKKCRYVTTILTNSLFRGINDSLQNYYLIIWLLSLRPPFSQNAITTAAKKDKDVVTRVVKRMSNYILNERDRAILEDIVREVNSVEQS